MYKLCNAILSGKTTLFRRVDGLYTTDCNDPDIEWGAPKIDGHTQLKRWFPHSVDEVLDAAWFIVQTCEEYGFEKPMSFKMKPDALVDTFGTPDDVVVVDGGIKRSTITHDGIEFYSVEDINNG